jgi:deoxyribonuclease II
MSSYCKPKHAYDVTNIQQIAWGVPANGLAYKETKEHSKWAISSDKTNWACIGDINRMDSQADRGGGTTCFYMAGLWRSLKNLIAAEDTCKS